MASSKANGSQAATPGTEHTLATITDAGVYQLYVDGSALAGTEALVLIEEMLVEGGGTYREVARGAVAAGPSSGHAHTVPRTVVHGIRYKLLQVGGSSRTFPWHVAQADA